MFPFFLCWGSFLNVLAFRLIQGRSVLYPRSQCPACSTQLAWYDLIPLISWFKLRGKCRSCSAPISALYPFIELLTAVLFSLLIFLVPTPYIPAYALFFSALIVTIRSDLETMLISRFVTLFLIPVGFALSYTQLLPINLTQSALGTILGFGFLSIISHSFLWLTGKEGIGQGDIELLAFIGSFTGAAGCWISLLFGSVFGSLVGGVYMMVTRPSASLKIPFGPFLAFCAIGFLLFQKQLIQLLLGLSYL